MSITRKRALLLGVAVLVSASGLLAIGILLVGRFGSVEGRILATTALLAGYGLVALPAVVLLDQERVRPLAAAATAAAVLGAVLALGLVWGDAGSDDFGRTVGSATIVALALAQVSALTALRGERGQVSVRRLFTASCATAAAASVFAVILLWAEKDGGTAPRFLGALIVLDLLLVTLQPLLARARSGALRRVTVVTIEGDRIDVEVTGGDAATAAARAIRSVERRGGSVLELTISEVERPAPDPGSSDRRRAAASSRRSRGASPRARVRGSGRR